ncbi:hypothetical protein O3M35_010008 [Rhynocoris fuscipes]|uniref:Ribosomal protein L20 n=1 Tax=Rhynocoris fuscipes TaxID=488301 RepID=A0AAW1CXC5_9HEMI
MNRQHVNVLNRQGVKRKSHYLKKTLSMVLLYYRLKIMKILRLEFFHYFLIIIYKINYLIIIKI